MGRSNPSSLDLTRISSAVARQETSYLCLGRTSKERWSPRPKMGMARKVKGGENSCNIQEVPSALLDDRSTRHIITIILVFTNIYLFIYLFIVLIYLESILVITI